MQSVFHHVLPLAATPGILDGYDHRVWRRRSGESAPLLLIGMVGFVAREYPAGAVTADAGLSGEASSALPAQVFTLGRHAADAGLRGTAHGAAIIALLVFLLIMNALAIVLRKKFERRW